MDFVVAGFGLGAVLMLIGFAVRDVGPLRNRSRQEDDSTRAWSELCRRVGAMIVVGGFAVCLATLLLLVVDVGDDTGILLVAMVSAAAVIGSGVGSVLTIRRYAEEQAVWSFRPAERSVRRDEAVEFEAKDAPDEHEETERIAAVQEVDEERPERVIGPVLEETQSQSPQGRIFASSILADVGADATTENGSGFRSSLLAGLGATGGKGSGRGYSSSVLANMVGKEGGQAVGDPVYGPPAPGETAKADANDGDAGDAEKQDQEPSASAEGKTESVAKESEVTGDDEAVEDKVVNNVGAPRMTQ